MSAGDDEAALIALIRERAGVARDDVLLGIGDDGAVLAPPPGRRLVVATDTLVAGVHFPRETRPADVGWKALAVNLSDLAAMGAEPAWALLSLTLPRADRDWVGAFAGGFAGLAREHGVALVGGDTARGEILVATVQVAGFVDPGGVLTRAGAAAGDAVFVTGTLGDAAAGLACVQGALEGGAWAGALRRRLDRPRPRIAAGRALAGVAGGVIDLSDGLAADLPRLAAAGGVGIRLELSALPASDALRAVAEGEAREAYQLAGDDYELCFTVAESRLGTLRARAGELDCPVTRIGTVVAGTGVAYERQGRRVTPPGRPWRHFREPPADA